MKLTLVAAVAAWVVLATLGASSWSALVAVIVAVALVTPWRTKRTGRSASGTREEVDGR